MRFTAAEIDTILAALRLWQCTMATAIPVEILELSVEHSQGLVDAQIDDLCEKINCGAGPRLIILVEGGVVQEVASDTDAVSVAVLDQDNREAEDDPDELDRYDELATEFESLQFEVYS